MQQSISVNREEDEQEQELQISEFIKDPTTLKLLILAGTNIRSTQLHTVSKCTNLIKLDLSSNMLSDLPMTFNQFFQLKILYLHDNNIFKATIEKTSVQYLSLFNNPMKNYRNYLIQHNPKLLGIDFNIITKAQVLNAKQQQFSVHTSQSRQLPKHTLLKWPIVQTSSNLESQEDYLNLLKAQIFVITNLHKKSISIQRIQASLKTFIHLKCYKERINSLSDQMKMRKTSVLDAVSQWKNYTKKKQKLRFFLKSKGKQHLLYNRMQISKLQLSPKTNQLVNDFMIYLRQRLSARKILQPYLSAYRKYVKTSFVLQCKIQQTSKVQIAAHKQIQKIYFLRSQSQFLEKIFLYSKRLLFSQKNYDLCDNFDMLVRKDKKQHYVFNVKQKNLSQRSFLMDTIRRSMSLIVAEKNLDRQHFLYNKKGHKKIAIKNRINSKEIQHQIKSMKSRIQQTTQKIDNMYNQYDVLICYNIADEQLFSKLMKIIRFFNSGNSSTILSNKTAYFQTEISYEDQKPVQKQKIFVGIQFYIKRVIAANVIQKFWRKRAIAKSSQLNVIAQIRQKRAGKLISHWMRNLIFQHRTLISKAISYMKTIQKSTQMYIHLDIYINLPKPRNSLKLNISPYNEIDEYTATKQTLYNLIHKDNYVEIVEIYGRKWVRIIFSSVEKALDVQTKLMYLTFRFYFNGFYLKLFNYFETQDLKILQVYQQKIKKLFKIKISVNNLEIQGVNNYSPISKKLGIDNSNSFFIWADMGQKQRYSIQNKFQLDRKSFFISIFIYNKHQRPLKINCQLNWLNPMSIYYNKKILIGNKSLHSSAITSIRSRTPTKRLSLGGTEKLITPSNIQEQYYINKLRSSDKNSRMRRNSSITPHNTSLLKNLRNKKRGVSEHIQMDLLSQTLNVRKK